MTPVIKMEDVTLSFPRRISPIQTILTMFNRSSRPSHYGLKKVNLEVKKGEIIGVIGRNGSGKSTLLRVMAGIYTPDQGVSKAAGRISLLAGLGIGFGPHLDGRENAMLYGSILGFSESEMNSRMEEIIEFSELGDFIDQPLRTYSSGMKARLGLSVASSLNPDILLIDEVLGVGDPLFKEKSAKKIMEMVEEAGTVVIVSHSFGLMKSICDKIVLMDGGEIVEFGEPEVAMRKYRELEKGD